MVVYSFPGLTLRRLTPRGYYINPLFRRSYSGPVVKRYAPLSTPLSVWWNLKVPVSAKYGAALVATALGVTHVHPNTLITLGPPVLAGAYFLYRRLEHASYLKLLQLVKNNAAAAESRQKTITIRKYDPANKEYVLSGIENEFDSFRSQVIPQVRSKLVEHVMLIHQRGQNSAMTRLLVDENDQISVHVTESMETFVLLKAEGDTDGVFPRFISFSVPFYSSRNVNLRHRLGTLQVSMIEVVKGDSDEATDEYTLAIQAWPYRMFSEPEVIL